MKTPASRGWYIFEDGYQCWFSGLNGTEKKEEIRRHGKIMRFIHTS